MEIVEEVQTTQKVVKRYCDDCSAELHWTMGCERRICEVCGKMLCNKCVAEEVESGGDYHIVYCKSCTDIYKKYKLELDRLDEIRAILTEQYRAEAKQERERSKGVV